MTALQTQRKVAPMNFNVLGVIVVIIAYTSSFSDSLEVTRPLKHSFQLQIGDYLGVHTFKNTWVSYKCHLSTNKAIRIGINLNVSYDGNYDPSNDNYKDISKNAGLSLNANFISYLYFDKTIKPYYGIGPYVSASYSGENTIVNGFAISSKRRRSFEVGLNGLFGLEWFFHNHFSLFTEYGLQGGFSYSISSDSRNPESNSKGLRLSSNNCLIGLSIYL